MLTVCLYTEVVDEHVRELRRRQNVPRFAVLSTNNASPSRPREPLRVQNVVETEEEG